MLNKYIEKNVQQHYLYQILLFQVKILVNTQFLN